MKKKGLFISIGVTLLIVLCFMFINKIVPFGNNLLYGINGNDDYSLYYVLYDYVHGINIYNIYDVISFLIVNNMISIPNMLIEVFPRSMIPNIVSIVFVLKVLLINGCMYFSLDRIFKDKSNFYKIIFSLLYTFSGFMLLHFYNINYLDILYLFPLLMLGYYRFIKEDKILLFNVIFILCGITNFSMFIVILFYLVGLIIFSFILLGFSDKKRKLIKLIISIILCIGMLSIFIYLNIDYYRSNFELYDGYGIYMDVIYLLYRKFIYLYPSGILFVYSIKGLFNKKNKKVNRFFMVMILYLLLCMFIDPVNKLWQMNLYYVSVNYISFILIFGLCFISMYNLDGKKDSFNILTLIVGSIIIILYGLIWFINRDKLLVNSINTYELIIQFFVTFILMILAVIIISKKNALINRILLCVFMGVELVINYFMYINIYDNNNSLINTNEIKVNNDYYKSVDYTGLLKTDMGIIKGMNTIQGSSYLSNTDKVLMADSLGFITYGNQVSSCCGNLITNSILLNKYVYTTGDFNEKLFELIDEKDNNQGNNVKFKTYQSKYNLSYIIPYSGRIYDLDYGDMIRNTNEIYKVLFNKEDNIINEVSLDKKLKLSKDSIYYLIFNEYNDLDSLVKYDVKAQYIYELNGKKYLSMYVDNDVDISLDKERFNLYELKIDDYINFINEYSLDIKYDNGIIKYNAIDDQSLLIPISYNDNLVIKVNDKEIGYKKNLFNMISIDVLKGENVIEINYKDNNMMKYIIASIISLIIYIGLSIVYKKICR